jgi:hypothetical protein
MFGATVSRGQSRWERFAGGNQPVPGHQHLRRFLAGAGAELDPGGIEVAVDGLGRDAEARGDLFAAIAFHHVAKAVPLPIAQERRNVSREGSLFPHASSLPPLIAAAHRPMGAAP